MGLLQSIDPVLDAYVWPCPYCPFEAFGPDTNRTGKHVRAVHPERLYEWNARTRGLIVELVTLRIEAARLADESSTTP